MPDESGRSLVHEFRNFGETVFRHLRASGLGALDLAEVDCATDHFVVRDVKASKLRRLTHWIEQEAAQQYLKVTTDVS